MKTALAGKNGAIGCARDEREPRGGFAGGGPVG